MPYAPSHTTAACNLSLLFSPRPPPLPLLLCLFHLTFSIKIAFMLQEWGRGRGKRETEKRSQWRGKVWLWWWRGGGWSSNQQLTGVRMFMGRVSLSDWSSDTLAVALCSLNVEIMQKQSKKTGGGQIIYCHSKGVKKTFFRKVALAVSDVKSQRFGFSFLILFCVSRSG